MKKLNKRDLIAKVAEVGHLSKKDATIAIDLCFDEIVASLKAGDEVCISNFGAFEVKERKTREGTHPKTHQPLTIEAKRAVSFRPAKSLKKDLN